MSISRYDPWNILNQMNEILGSSLRNGENSSIYTNQWVPAVDIREEKDRYLVEVDLPGVDKNAIEVSMDNRILNIKGERREEYKVEANSYARTERIYGSFHRQFTLPDTVDSDKIKASYTNGVLKLSIPKKEMAKPKRINITNDEQENVSFIEHQQIADNQVA